MRTILAAALFLSAVFPALVDADELAAPAVDEAVAAPPALPRKGMQQAQVLKAFGEPQMRHGAVGGDSARHPPIVRWDYPGFSVFFENTHVVDAVVPGRPAPLYHTDQLAPAHS